MPSTMPIDADMAGARPARRVVPRADRPWPVASLLGIVALAIVVTTVRNPEGVVVSADPGYTPVAVPLLLVPAAVTVAVTLLLPRGSGPAGVAVRRPSAARRETIGLIGLSAAFTLLVPVLPLPEDYVLLKAALFLLVPCLVLGLVARWRGSSVDIARPRVAAWIMAVPALALGVLSTVGPWTPAPPSVWPPLAVLLIAATATAITAGLGEEILYRRLLQTRLESLTGPWTGLLIASLLFGLMHSFSHGDGALWENALQAIALQGTTGLAIGLIWSRWRRIWACVLAHVLLNGLGVLMHLAEQLI